MRPIQLDFASRTSRLRMAGMGLLVLAALATVWTAVNHYNAQRAQTLADARQMEAQRLRASQAEPESQRQARAERLRLGLLDANLTIAHLALPWGRLFDEIAASVDEDVVLLEVIPDIERRTIKITAEARSLVAMSAYVKRLGGSAMFQDPYVQSHQIQVLDPQKPVRFVVHGNWMIEPMSPEPMAEAQSPK